jgi:regulator of replication initiation timing
MKSANPIEESQRRAKDEEYFKKKYKEVKQENKELRKENTELKKNLDSFSTKTPLLL